MKINFKIYGNDLKYGWSLIETLCFDAEPVNDYDILMEYIVSLPVGKYDRVLVIKNNKDLCMDEPYLLEYMPEILTRKRERKTND